MTARRFTKPRTAVKIHGGKCYLSARINAMMPTHTHYCEAYGGGLSVLLGHDGEGRSELVNDIDSDLMNFWHCIAGAGTFRKFMARVALAPFARDTWTSATHLLKSGPPGAAYDVDRAVAFFVAARLSYAGRMEEFAIPTRTRLRGNMNADVNAYLSAVDGLPAIHARLGRVFIENMDALDLIPREDTPETLFYLDPTYYKPTRASPDVYRHEMTEAEHIELLRTITRKGFRGRVMLSGYRSDLYDGYLKKWTRVDIKIPNHAAGGAAKRIMTECVYCNFVPENRP